MDDHGLVVIHPRVRLPGAIYLGLLNLQPLFKISRAFNLSCDQDRPVDQKRWASFNQQLNPLTLQIVQGRRR